MIDGGFRENAYGIDFFCKQDFPEDEYEVIWVDYYNKAHPNAVNNPRIKVVTLGRNGTYHSSYCFNKGINESKGEVIVIPDADQIVNSNFLTRVWNIHTLYHKLVVYGYRYDQKEEKKLHSLNLIELRKKCVLKNPLNYGGCLTVRKKWLEKINGYEQHPIFATGNHANGLDLYTRFKNFGLSVQWEPTLKLYHPWHFSTLMPAKELIAQKKLIEWRKQNIQWLSFMGMNSDKNVKMPPAVQLLLEKELINLREDSFSRLIRLITKIVTSAAIECFMEIKRFHAKRTRG